MSYTSVVYYVNNYTYTMVLLFVYKQCNVTAILLLYGIKLTLNTLNLITVFEFATSRIFVMALYKLRGV